MKGVHSLSVSLVVDASCEGRHLRHLRTIGIRGDFSWRGIIR
jgi:hypothetical protein